MLWSDFERILDPWREFERLNRAVSRFGGEAEEEFPAFNVWVSPDDAVVTTEIAGVDPDDMDISVSGKTLTLHGSRKGENLNGDHSYHRKERWSGSFSKTINLPFNIEPDKVSARLSKGVLSLTLPKAEEEKPKKIDVVTA